MVCPPSVDPALHVLLHDWHSKSAVRIIIIANNKGKLKNLFYSQASAVRPSLFAVQIPMFYIQNSNFWEPRTVNKSCCTYHLKHHYTVHMHDFCMFEDHRFV